MCRRKVKLGRLVKVTNQNPKPLANKSYYSVWVENEDRSQKVCRLFTEHELSVAENRAKSNPEDVPCLKRDNWIVRLINWIVGG